MFCTNCGREISSNASFCTFCGTKVAAEGVRKPVPAVSAEAEPDEKETALHDCIHDDCQGSITYGTVISDYIARNPSTSKSVLVGGAITSERLADFHLKPGEHPYVVINKLRNPYISILFCPRRNGLVITDCGIHYRSWGHGLIKLGLKVGFVDWNDVQHFQVGEYDGGYAYNGHTFEINHQSIGLVRMGTSVCCDDKVTEFLNGLSVAMVEAHLLKDMPTEYCWQ